MPEVPAILLVHGAFHGAWCWDDVVPILEAAGREVRTVDLPTVHAARKAELGLADDTATVREAIEAIDGPVVVVGHSYGGVPVTVGAAGLPNVVHLVYVSAFALDEGESLLGAVGGVAPDWWDVHDGLVRAGKGELTPTHLFFHDVPEDRAAAASARLTSQPIRAFTDPVTAVAWRSVPSTYIVTERDQAGPVAGQEALAARAGSRVVRMPTSHSPFLSQPEATAQVILAAGA